MDTSFTECSQETYIIGTWRYVPELSGWEKDDGTLITEFLDRTGELIITEDMYSVIVMEDIFKNAEKKPDVNEANVTEVKINSLSDRTQDLEIVMRSGRCKIENGILYCYVELTNVMAHAGGVCVERTITYDGSILRLKTAEKMIVKGEKVTPVGAWRKIDYSNAPEFSGITNRSF
jgi:hypothetical protein